MKRLIFILLAFISLSASAQIYDTLPAGSKPYGNQLYISPTGLIIGGTGSAKFRVLGTKKYVDSLLALKVDVVPGKGLSTNDYTTSEKDKLAGIATGATANQTDAYLLSRANHTGTQAQSTITNLTTDLANKVSKTGDETIAGDKTFSGFTKHANMYVGNSTNNVQLTSGDIKYNIGTSLLSVYPLPLTANRVQRYQDDDGVIALVKNLNTGQTIGANTTGSAATLTTARNIGLSGVTATAQPFNGGSNITIPITAVPGSLVTGTVPNATNAVNANTATKWGGGDANFSVLGTNLTNIVAFDNLGVAKPYSVTQVKTALNTTLQDATTAGNRYQSASNYGTFQLAGNNAVGGNSVQFYGNTNFYAEIAGEYKSTGIGQLILRTVNAGSPQNTLTLDGTNNSATFLGNISAPNLASGTFTPTIINTSNMTSVSAYQCLYTRVGNNVTYSGAIRCATPATGAISFQMDLPIGSNFVNTKDATGTASGNAVSFGTVQAQGTNNLLITGASNLGGVTQHDIFFTCQYIIK